MEIRRRSPAPAVIVESHLYQIAVPDAEPRNILEKIVWHKNYEVERLREHMPLSQLQRRIHEQSPPRPFVAALTGSPHPVALIAEVKRASPSKGILREDFDPVAIAQAYADAGASCISVLTDIQFFQGSGDYLLWIRDAVACPLLCKEFIIYPYQVLWARSLGADAILLIAAILSDADLGYLLKLIHTYQMAVLIEVHTLAEFDRVVRVLTQTVDPLGDLSSWVVMGINNRDLTTFAVDLGTTGGILAERGDAIRALGIAVVSESGIHTPADLEQVNQWGVRAVLVGEALVKAADPGQATRTLLGKAG